MLSWYIPTEVIKEFSRKNWLIGSDFSFFWQTKWWMYGHRYVRVIVYILLDMLEAMFLKANTRSHYYMYILKQFCYMLIYFKSICLARQKIKGIHICCCQVFWQKWTNRISIFLFHTSINLFRCWHTLTKINLFRWLINLCLCVSATE